MDQNDLPIEVVLHRIGSCPVCGKGQMLQGTAGWACDYFRTITDKCTFTIFGKYGGYELTEDDAVDLITRGETAYHDCTTLSGVQYTARLVRKGERISIVGDNSELDVPCPACGARVKETQRAWACENYFRDADRCLLYVPKNLCGRDITAEEVTDLLEHGRSAVLDGFEHDGREFSAYMHVLPDGTCRLDSAVCPCPVCGGQLYAASKGFVCSNYSNPAVRCRFVIWRNSFGHQMSVDEVITLCRLGATPVLTFRRKDGVEYSGRLVINDQGQVIRI